ncbi:MAG: hypothetical protein ABSD59_19130 [Terracidiphilus sp.]|jgi:hypothetical protein
MKNTRLLILGACAAVLVSAANAQITWTATSSPTQTTIAGGPWTLVQGGPYTEVAGTTTVGGPFDGTIPYCSNGVPILNSLTTMNPTSPYYFPFVAGSGLNLQGYFDYRPRNVNEAIVSAISADGGQTWTFENQIENLNQVCPATDKNGSGNDDGVGHPYVINFAGAGFLYALDRRNGHVDNDGLLVHTLMPKAGSPLNGLPVNTEFGPPGTSAIPTSAVIAQWEMELAGGTSNSPAPNIGTGTATALGMTNTYKGPSPTCTGAACEYTGSTNKDDITSTNGGTDPNLSAEAWRVRGTTKLTGGSSGPGWNTQAPEDTQGVEFAASTVGFSNIVVQFDWYTTAEIVRDLQTQYTTDGSTWTNIGPVYIAPVGGGFYPGITINFAGITSVNNNPNFGVRMVSVYDRSANAPTPFTYTAATLGTNGAPVQYNDSSGNWRFDEVNILGSATGGKALTLPTETVGLTNPDGILAYVPNSYPFKILYVDKTLNADYAFPTAEQCGPTLTGAAANHDTEYIHLATSTDSIHWTDQGAVTGLNDPTTTSYHSIRYMAPNGSLLKLSSGNWGLFFGGGNCLDGDSDGFHAIMYAESPDLIHWTVINGIDNPIASVSPVTDPNTGATIPLNTPVIGTTQPWFTGRVYNPNAMIASPTTINLIFDGYDAAYSADISDYRTIGHVGLSAAGATLP